MNRFLSWLHQLRKQRAIRFAWKTSDIEHFLPSLKENSIVTPKSISNHIEQLKQWKKHNQSLDDKHISHLYGYKVESEINQKLNSKSPLSLHEIDHVKHLDRATSYKTEHPITVYRGYDSEHENSSFPVGSELINHGYTSTTLKKKTASAFSDGDATKKPTLFKINILPGTRSHHIDADNRHLDSSYKGIVTHHINPHPHEGEVLIGRKQRFKVTNHSEDKDYKYIHLDTI